MGVLRNDMALSRLRNIVSDLANEVRFSSVEAAESAEKLAEEATDIIDTLSSNLGTGNRESRNLTLRPE